MSQVYVCLRSTCVSGLRVSQVYVPMAMSLDGFIIGPHDDAQNPAGIEGMRLMDWLGGGGDADGVMAYRPSDTNSQIVFDEALATGAVITGRRTGDFAGDRSTRTRSNNPARPTVVCLPLQSSGACSFSARSGASLPPQRARAL